MPLVAMPFVAAFTALGVACSGPTASSTAAPVSRGEPLAYAFGTTDGAVVTSETTRGRVTVLLFLTTFDLASQAQAKHLEQLYRRHAPRFNALGVVMEPPRNAELARSFGEVLGLSYPIALADAATLSGDGPFGAVTSVPSWLILDREARAVFAKAGALAPSALEKAVSAAER